MNEEGKLASHSLVLEGEPVDEALYDKSWRVLLGGRWLGNVYRHETEEGGGYYYIGGVKWKYAERRDAIAYMVIVNGIELCEGLAKPSLEQDWSNIKDHLALGGGIVAGIALALATLAVL